MSRVSLAFFVGCATVLMSSVGFADTMGTEWDFNGNLNAMSGTSTMSYWGGTTSSKVSFGTAASYGISEVPGNAGKTVMYVDALSPTEGLAVTTGAANGGGAKVNQYTMVLDVMTVPTSAFCHSFWNTDPTNMNDAKMAWFNPGGTGTIGYVGNDNASVQGSMLGNAWTRLAVSVDAAAGKATAYINGSPVVDPYPTVPQDGNKSLSANSNFLFLTDNSNETGKNYISMLYYVPNAMSGSDIAALGGAGHALVPEPTSLTLAAFGVAGLLAYAWRKRS